MSIVQKVMAHEAPTINCAFVNIPIDKSLGSWMAERLNTLISSAPSGYKWTIFGPEDIKLPPVGTDCADVRLQDYDGENRHVPKEYHINWCENRFDMVFVFANPHLLRHLNMRSNCMMQCTCKKPACWLRKFVYVAAPTPSVSDDVSFLSAFVDRYVFWSKDKFEVMSEQSGIPSDCAWISPIGMNMPFCAQKHPFWWCENGGPCGNMHLLDDIGIYLPRQTYYGMPDVSFDLIVSKILQAVDLVKRLRKNFRVTIWPVADDDSNGLSVLALGHRDYVKVLPTPPAIELALMIVPIVSPEAIPPNSGSWLLSGVMRQGQTRICPWTDDVKGQALVQSWLHQLTIEKTHLTHRMHDSKTISVTKLKPGLGDKTDLQTANWVVTDLSCYPQETPAKEKMMMAQNIQQILTLATNNHDNVPLVRSSIKDDFKTPCDTCTRQIKEQAKGWFDMIQSLSQAYERTMQKPGFSMFDVLGQHMLTLVRVTEEMTATKPLQSAKNYQSLANGIEMVKRLFGRMDIAYVYIRMLFLVNLAFCQQKANEFDKAMFIYQRAVDYYNKSPVKNATHSLGPEHSELRQQVFKAHANMGEIEFQRKNMDEAIKHFDRSLSFYFDPHIVSTLGSIYEKRDEHERSYALFNTLSLMSSPEIKSIGLNNTATLLKAVFRQFDAVMNYREAEELVKSNSILFSNELLTMLYSEEFSPSDVYARSCAWADRFIPSGPGVAHVPKTSDALVLPTDQPAPSTNPDKRKLRLGYISADFRAHPVGIQIFILLNLHKTDYFDIFLYDVTAGTTRDSFNDVFRNLSSSRGFHYRDVADLSTDDVAAVIINDQLDVLVETQGHVGQNRVDVYKFKLARCIAAWFAFPGTLGIRNQNNYYKLVDEYTCPKEYQSHYTETLHHIPWLQTYADLSHCPPLKKLVLPYVHPKATATNSVAAETLDKKDEKKVVTMFGYEEKKAAKSASTAVIDVTGPQTERLNIVYSKAKFDPHVIASATTPSANTSLVPDGHVHRHTKFCCFQNPHKYSKKMIHCWAEILKRVPNSVLYLRFFLLENSVVRQVVIDQFAINGVSADRLNVAFVRGVGMFLDLFNSMDISLDVFPYTGGISSTESLYYNTPMVTLVGKSYQSRVTASLLHCLGMDELIAQTTEEYIDIACKLAADLPRLEMYHKTIKQKMTTTGLANAPMFAAAMEKAYYDLGRKHGFVSKLSPPAFVDEQKTTTTQPSALALITEINEKKDAKEGKAKATKGTSLQSVPMLLPPPASLSITKVNDVKQTSGGIRVIE